MRDVTCILALVFIPICSAQEQPLFRTDATLITVPVTVSDERGKPVDGLKSEEFQLYDNGVPQKIRSVSYNEQRPLTIGMIEDVSPSQHSYVREHQAYVADLIPRLLRTGDRAFVVAVGHEVTLGEELIGRSDGTGHVLLPRGGEVLGTPCSSISGRHLCGETALWKGVYDTAHLELSRFAGSKALLIFSDGFDTGSIHSIEEARAEINRVGASVYVISSGTDAPADDLLRLAMNSGGVVFAANDRDYSQVIEKIGLDLRSRYVLMFSPEIVDHARHELKVEVSRTGVVVRARREYIPPGQ